MVPGLPTAQARFLELPAIACSLTPGKVSKRLQLEPFQRSNSPTSVTAQTSSVPLPQIPRTVEVVLLEVLNQALPSKCRIVPAPPPAQTSLGPVPQTQ